MQPIYKDQPMVNQPSDDRRQLNQWTGILHEYRTASSLRAAWELAITSLAFISCWVLLQLAVDKGELGLYVPILLLGAGFLVRLFMIQHDCGHGSFFASRRLNDWVGRIIGVITLTPYYQWRRSHAVHHATSGNLDRRGIGDVLTLTVAEYSERSRWGRARYWLYRHPAVMFGIGPLYLFLLQNRVPVGFMHKGWRPWFSTMGTNASVICVAAILIWAVGPKAFSLIYLPLILLGSGAGVWLFYVQHQFEDTHWANGANWSAQEAALYGSSHYDLPKVLRWFTANIGLHHVHHLASRIPFYRLPEVLRDHAEFRSLGRITFLQSLKGLRLVLWDENIQRLVSFRQLRAEYAASRTQPHASQEPGGLHHLASSS
jgi:omega-6 fatty acid desaturase (delta-12 desaturase)